VVGEASNGREGIAKFPGNAFRDVTLMDLQMPDMNGIDVMMAIRDEFPEARIIVLTTLHRRCAGFFPRSQRLGLKLT